MPKFTIVEIITEKRVIEAPTAQAALDDYLAHGGPDEFECSVDERWVEDEHGDDCEVTDQ